MDEPCPIQVLSFSCIKNETTEVVSQKFNFKGSPQNKDFLTFYLLFELESYVSFYLVLYCFRYLFYLIFTDYISFKILNSIM